jgi:hypothetical protein
MVAILARRGRRGARSLRESTDLDDGSRYSPRPVPPTPPTKTSARRVLLAGAATALIAVIMAALGSGLAPADERSPYASAIVALELARTPADVGAALGPEGATSARPVVGLVTHVDFAFLVAYPLLQLAIVAFLTRGRAARVAAGALALAMAAGDALENVALLALLEEPTRERLASIALWTTVKWGALFAAMALTAGLLVARGGLSRALAAVPAVTAVAGAVGLASAAHRPLVEIAGVIGVAATWAIALVMAVTTVARRR